MSGDRPARGAGTINAGLTGAGLTNALDAAFRRSTPALVCYLPIGDPGLPDADPALYLDEGVDVLEIGVGVDEPALDGPVVSASMSRARKAGLDNVIAATAIEDLRGTLGDPATVWMTYPAGAAQPGWSAAVERSGAHGALVAGAAPADVPAPSGVHRVGFLPHRPTPAQLESMTGAGGYVMVAADDGVTGPRPEVSADNATLLRRIREAVVTVPLLLGFGIADAEDARAAIGCGADGVVVGTAVLTAAADGRTALRRLLRDLRRGLDG